MRLTSRQAFALMAALLLACAPCAARAQALSQLPSGSSANLGDLVPVTQGYMGVPGTGTTRHITLQQLFGLLGPTAQLGTGGGTFSESTPISGATVSAPAGTGMLLLKPASALAALTVALPPSPAAGALFCADSTQAVTTLTLTSGTVQDPPGYLIANWAECFRFDGAVWNRVTDAGLPSPAVIAAAVNANTQATAALASANAVKLTVLDVQTAIDTEIAGFDPPPQATTGTQGLVLAGPASGGCAAFDANGFADQACVPTAFEPFPAVNLALTAAGTTQADCLQLAAGFNVVNGGGGGGVCLPPASAGLPTTVLSVINGTITIYPAQGSSDTIAGAAAGVGTLLPGMWGEKFRTVTAGGWQLDSTVVPAGVYAPLNGPGFTGQASSAGPFSFNGNVFINQLILHKGLVRVVATNGGNATVPANTDTVELDPAAGIATFSETLPVSPADGQDVVVLCGQTITTLTLVAPAGQSIRPATSGSGTSISGPCQPSFGGAARVRYNGAQTAWFPG